MGTSSGAAPYSPEECFQSEMQILMSLPGCIDQIWHSDNARGRPIWDHHWSHPVCLGGLTVIIPLVDCSLAQGPTQGSSDDRWLLLSAHQDPVWQ
jgi:hypothetical protein